MVTYEHIYNLLLGLDIGFGSFDWDHSQMDVHSNSNLGFLPSTTLPGKRFPTVWNFLCLLDCHDLNSSESILVACFTSLYVNKKARTLSTNCGMGVEWSSLILAMEMVTWVFTMGEGQCCKYKKSNWPWTTNNFNTLYMWLLSMNKRRTNNM